MEVGGLTISLVERGAAHATIIDASHAYVETSRALAAEHGVADALTARGTAPPPSAFPAT